MELILALMSLVPFVSLASSIAVARFMRQDFSQWGTPTSHMRTPRAGSEYEDESC